jgi:hypothetical protein
LTSLSEAAIHHRDHQRKQAHKPGSNGYGFHRFPLMVGIGAGGSLVATKLMRSTPFSTTVCITKGVKRRRSFAGALQPLMHYSPAGTPQRSNT